MEEFRLIDKKDKQITQNCDKILSEPLLVSSWGLPALEKLETGARESTDRMRNTALAWSQRQIVIKLLELDNRVGKLEQGQAWRTNLTSEVAGVGGEGGQR